MQSKRPEIVIGLAGLALSAIAIVVGITIPEIRCRFGLQSEVCRDQGSGTPPDRPPDSPTASTDAEGRRVWTGSLSNPDWQEVPGTYAEAFKGSAFVDRAGLTRTGSFVVFDMVDPEAAYFRIEVDCSAPRWRILRRGEFEEGDSIEYTITDAPWQDRVTPWQQAIVGYVCSR